MKTLFYIILSILGSNMLTAQVGINTNNPDPSAALDISGTNKGVSFPQISIPSRTSAAPITGAAESIIVYNTNTNLIGGESYYFWNNAKWDFLFSDIQTNLLLNLIKYHTKTTTNAYNKSNYTGTTNNLQDNLNSDWLVIDDLTESIVVDRATNEALFTVSGMIQGNNTTTGIALLSLGVFVDDKLVAIKPIYFNLATNCSYRTFKVIASTKNIAAGTHSVKIAVKNYSSTISSLRINYGSKDASCSNINNNEAKLSSVVILNQPFNF